MEEIILALDLGGSNIKGGLFGSDAVSLHPPQQVPVNSMGSENEILGAIRNFVESVANGCAINRVSISVPGPFGYRDGVSEMRHKYGALRGINLREELYKCKGIPRSAPIAFLSDANAYLIGEVFFGAGKGCENCAAVTLGTGLGYAVMEEGAVLVDGNDRPYDILCFVPFRGGVLEDFISATGVAAAYGKRTGVQTTAKKMAENRDPDALAIFREMGRELGKALFPRMNAHHTRRLIVGGQMANALELFKAPLEQELPAVEIVRARNPMSAALYGAAAHAAGLEKPWVNAD